MDRIVYQHNVLRMPPTYVMYGHVWVDNDRVCIQNHYCYAQSSDLRPVGTVLVSDNELNRSLIYVHPGSHVRLQ